MIYVNDEVDKVDLHTLERIAPQRREYILRFKHEHAQRERLAAWLLLCEGLRREYGITHQPELGYDEHGKPFIIGRQDIYFNFSHSHHVAVCAIDNVPIGIDVEVIRPYKDRVAQYVLNEEEYEQVKNSEHPDLQFAKFWTMKESLMKLKGCGIGNHLKEVLSQEEPPSNSSSLNREGVETQETKKVPVFSTTVTEQYVYTVCKWL